MRTLSNGGIEKKDYGPGYVLCIPGLHQVKLWDPKSGKLLATLDHSGEVLSVACSPDGAHIAAGAWDKTLKIWDAP